MANDSVKSTDGSLATTIGLTQTNHLSIYPNPSDGAVTISGTRDVFIKNIAVYNLLGKRIHTTCENTSLTKGVSLQINAQAGVSLLVLTTDNGTVLQEKIIIK